jgi:hypothetical protein
MFELFGTGHRGPPHGGTTLLLISTATHLIVVVMILIVPLMYVSTELPPVCDRTESDSVASNSGVSGASCLAPRVEATEFSRNTTAIDAQNAVRPAIVELCTSATRHCRIGCVEN